MIFLKLMFIAHHSCSQKRVHLKDHLKMRVCCLPLRVCDCIRYLTIKWSIHFWNLSVKTKNTPSLISTQRHSNPSVEVLFFIEPFRLRQRQLSLWFTIFLQLFFRKVAYLASLRIIKLCADLQEDSEGKIRISDRIERQVSFPFSKLSTFLMCSIQRLCYPRWCILPSLLWLTLSFQIEYAFVYILIEHSELMQNRYFEASKTLLQLTLLFPVPLITTLFCWNK